jgi:hypothetical protein
MGVLDAGDKAVVRALCRYWREHPLASDSADGIARWWLGSDVNQPVSMDMLQRALGWLQQQGVAVSSRAADGRLRWRRGGDDAALQRVMVIAMVMDP